jgi:hypothetical protein
MDTVTPSFAWRGPRGSGKRTHLLSFLEKQATKFDIKFTLKFATWFLVKQTAASADPDDDDGDDESTGKSIPYEESPLHLGFDVARMSMSDKVFLQSVLKRWTGQQDVCLTQTNVRTRYLVLYHAHYLTDESVLQLQEALEQYQGFTLLITTELPLCSRLRDYCLDIPVPGKDKLLEKYTAETNLETRDVWKMYFAKMIEEWSKDWSAQRIVDVRNWIYVCLQRNLRWTDVIMYWIETIYETPWIDPPSRARLMKILYEAESGSGWVLVTSYRIPILWEHVHLNLAKNLYSIRESLNESTSKTD